MKCLHNSENSYVDHSTSQIQITNSKRALNLRGGATKRAQFSRTAFGWLGETEPSEVCDDEGQARKSARGMPWHQEPMKDATSCEKPRGGANILRSVDIRMGKPGTAIPCQRAMNKIVVRGEPPELKHLSRARKRHQTRFRK